MNQTDTVTRYTQLDNGIHQLVLTQPTRQAVDEWMAITRDLYTQLAPDDVMRLLLIIQHDLPPIQYTIQQSKAFMQRYPERPRTRTAILHEKTILGGLITNIVNGMVAKGRDAVMLAGLHEEARAIHWLLQEI